IFSDSENSRDSPFLFASASCLLLLLGVTCVTETLRNVTWPFFSLNFFTRSRVFSRYCSSEQSRRYLLWFTIHQPQSRCSSNRLIRAPPSSCDRLRESG